MFSPSSDSKSVSLGAELLLSEMLFSAYSGETAPQHPGANCETFPEVDLHCKDASKEDMMSKNGHLI
jgi:hypothetical protein